jgi:hypothetical protein
MVRQADRDGRIVKAGYPTSLRSLSGWAAGLAVTGMVVTPALAIDTPFGKDAKGAIGVCAAERAPLVARQKEFSDLKRARLGAAVAEGAKAGAGVLIGGMMGGMGGMMGGGRGGGGLPGGFGLPGGLAGGLPGGIPGMAGMPGGAAGGADIFSQALAMKIPGVTSGAGSFPGGFAGQGGGGDQARALIAVSIVVAVAGTVDAYMKLKQQQFQNDARAMAISIEGDAGSQVPIGSETATQVGALTSCRERQVTELQTKLSSASNDKDRRALKKETSGLQSALKTDLDLSDEIVGQQVNLAKTFTQGRAMAEGKSEADVLGGQAPAYAAEASRTPLRLPPVTAAAPGAPAAPMAPAMPALVTTRAAAVRSEPSAKAGVIMNFAAGRSVTPKGRAPGDPSWWEVDIGGTSGYIRGADLGEPGATVAKGKGGRSSGPPQLAPPNNIRNYNRQVLVAKNAGPDRLKMLNTQIETGRLKLRTPGDILLSKIKALHLFS